MSLSRRELLAALMVAPLAPKVESPAPGVSVEWTRFPPRESKMTITLCHDFGYSVADFDDPAPQRIQLPARFLQRNL